MSTQSFLMGAGPFRTEIADCLEYPAKLYKNCDEKTTVFSEMFIVDTIEETHQLAALLGCKANDFSTHRIDVKALIADPDRVAALSEISPQCMQELQVLAAQPRWVFYFRINT
jgi:predicted ester cyclase